MFYKNKSTNLNKKKDFKNIAMD